MARFVAGANAANNIPSMTNNKPIAARKSDIDAVKPTAANYLAPDGFGAACESGCGRPEGLEK